MRGTHLELRDEGEGWFPGVNASVIGGRIEVTLGPVRGGNRWYVVRLDDALEVQESGHHLRSIRRPDVWASCTLGA